MDLGKIGAFIAQQRKAVGLTQEKLAGMLNITDKAVSKWERGISFPDANLLSQLCMILKCSITDLLSGELYSPLSSNRFICSYPHSSADINPAAETIIHLAQNSERIVSPYLFGENLEHTRDCIHHGLSAEMLENRKFAGKPSRPSGCAYYWQPIGEKVFFVFDSPYTCHGEGYRMKRRDECNAQRITSFTSDEPAGIKQGNLVVSADQTYEFSIVAKATADVTLHIALLDMEGSVLTSTVISLTAHDDYHEQNLILTPARSCNAATLSITFQQACSVYLGAVSMMPSGHFRGMRRDVIQRLKDMGVSILRWPGGNFAGEYHWKDGLLPKNKRAPLQSALVLATQPHSLGYDYHEINIDDFIALCREINAIPYITLNPVWNTPEESAQWVEYCNGDETTEYGRLRISRGYPEPYNVQLWTLGNEPGYGHMEGPNIHYDYSQALSVHANAMLKVCPSLTLCSSGPYPNKDWINYSAKVLGKVASLVSLHHYIFFPSYADEASHKQDYESFINQINERRTLIAQMRQDLGTDSLWISFDEWNSWDAWYRPGNVSDGILTALTLHMFITEAADLGICVACHFEAINEGAITVTPTSAQLTPTGHAFALISKHANGRLLHSSYNAVVTEKDGHITATIVNPAYDQTLTYVLSDLGVPTSAKTYTSQSVLPYSDFEIGETTGEVKDSGYALSLPPHSITILTW